MRTLDDIWLQKNFTYISHTLMNLAFDKFVVAKSVFIKLFACFFNIKSDFTKNDNFLY